MEANLVIHMFWIVPFFSKKKLFDKKTKLKFRHSDSHTIAHNQHEDQAFQNKK